MPCPDLKMTDEAIKSAGSYSWPYGHGIGERIDVVACCHVCDVGD